MKDKQKIKIYFVFKHIFSFIDIFILKVHYRGNKIYNEL